ncbi:MAG: hypothetical protein ACJ762_18645 [Solirubrobacteraceae bacterium]
MPTFCRHGRLQANCPICSKSDEPTERATPSRAPRLRSATPRTPKASSGIRVRRVERAPEDGYDNVLVPGLRSSIDGARFADELAFSVARLEELASSPPGLYAEVAGASDIGEAVWLAFLIAYVSPGRGGDPWSDIESARAGNWPHVHGGPRTGFDARRAEATVDGFRSWLESRGGAEAALGGEPDWEPSRRFARTFERITLPGFPRGAKYDFLVSLGALGRVPVEATTLAVGKDAMDPVISAAKRVLGIGDAMNLERRAADLARGTGVPFAALDLALFNFGAAEDERATMAARVTADPERRAQIAKALDVA